MIEPVIITFWIEVNSRLYEKTIPKVYNECEPIVSQIYEQYEKSNGKVVAVNVIHINNTKIRGSISMVKSNGSDINDDEILSDVEIVYALAKIKHFKDIVQTVSIKRYSQEEYVDVVEAIFEEIFNPRTDKEKQ